MKKFENEVVCQICGYKHLTTIQNHLRWKHQIKPREYMDKYDAEITSTILKERRKKLSSVKHGPMSDEEKQKRSKANKKFWENNDEMKRGVSDRMKKLAKEGKHPKQSIKEREKARQHMIKINKSEKQINRVKKALTGIKLSKERCEAISKGHIGVLHTEEAKKKISKTKRKGFANGKYSLPKRTTGKKGYYYSTKMKKEIYYDSLLELEYYKILDNDIKIKTYEKCPLRIQYLTEDGWHTYFPDVFINGNEIHEIKSKWTWYLHRKINKLKLKAANKFFNY